MFRLTPEGKAALPDFIRFGKNMLRSKDIDPLYPILMALIAEQGMDEEESYWLQFLYVAWYNLPVAYRAWTEYQTPDAGLLEALDPSWPTGIERRANRGGKVKFHIASYLKAIEDNAQVDWYHHGLRHPGAAMELEAWQLHENWHDINHRLQTLWGNGRWAAYKHCEVLRRVDGMPIEAPDMGNQFSSGPRQGLAYFYGDLEGQQKDVIEVLDAQGEDLQRRCLKRGLVVDIEELETLLCNWKALVHGKYYVGHDIDENQEQIEVARERRIISKGQSIDLYKAREASLPHHYLGELNGWTGIDRRRLVAYRDNGRVVGRKTS